jgi:hypothetical protein
VVVIQRQAKLLQVVATLSAPRGFSCHLNRWQQERDQDRNDRNDDEQLNQREPFPTSRVHVQPSNEKRIKSPVVCGRSGYRLQTVHIKTGSRPHCKQKNANYF